MGFSLLSKMRLNSKRAAMEMSVGTMVTIVLLMAVLILGIFFIQKIFGAGTTAIDEIDQSVKNEIRELFSQDESRQIVIYPSAREIRMKKGDSGGFGFALKNTGYDDGVFSYTISVLEVGSNCQMTEAQADNLIILGKSGSNIQIPSGSELENPILVKFSIPKTAPLCNIRYGIDVKKDGEIYLPTVSVDLEIK